MGPEGVQRILMTMSGCTAKFGFVGGVWTRSGVVWGEARVFLRGKPGVIDTIRVEAPAKERVNRMLERRVEEKYGPIKWMGWLQAGNPID